MGLHAVSHSMLQRLQNVIKKNNNNNNNNNNKKGMPVTEIWIHVLDREINILLKFQVKIKFGGVPKVRSSNFMHYNFWDTLYIKVV